MSNKFQQAVSVFEKTESTLIGNCVPGFTRHSRIHAARNFKRMLRCFRTASDDDFFFHMTMIVFYSGFIAPTVTKRRHIIHRYFNSYRKAAAYTRKDIARILHDPKMIANRNKVEKIVYNARQFIKLRKEFSSFRSYLLSFNPDYPLSDARLDDLREDLRSRFAYLGPATVNHFLIDYAFPVVKPDRMIMRVLHRTHLVAGESVHHYEKAIKICKDISERLDTPIRYVDTVFVCLGQVGEANICSKNKPRCHICDLERVCKFYD
ncbi:MAG: DNA-3-methyladenine glycosylase I [bacterium]